MKTCRRDDSRRPLAPSTTPRFRHSRSVSGKSTRYLTLGTALCRRTMRADETATDLPESVAVASRRGTDSSFHFVFQVVRAGCSVKWQLATWRVAYGSAVRLRTGSGGGGVAAAAQAPRPPASLRSNAALRVVPAAHTTATANNTPQT